MSINSKIGNKKQYLQLHEYAKNFDNSSILNEIKEYFDSIHNKLEIDYFALYLHIRIKNQIPIYIHGYLISSALHKFITSNKTIENINIFETGTDMGFSTLIMAHILDKNNRKGIIHTIDKVGHLNKYFWNSIEDHTKNAPKSRFEILERWKDLRDNYCNFITGESNNVIPHLQIDRIHFAFLDGDHHYANLIKELEFCDKNQLSGDVIICDDYTKNKYLDVCKAVNEFLEKKTYDFKIFFGDDNIKKRGYVYMQKK